MLLQTINVPQQNLETAMDNVARTDLVLETQNRPKTNKSHTPLPFVPLDPWWWLPPGSTLRSSPPPPDSLGRNNVNY